MESQESAIQAAMEAAGKVTAEPTISETETVEPTPVPTPEASPEAKPQVDAEVAPKSAMETYQEKLGRIMEEQRSKFEENQKAQQPDPQIEQLKRIEDALKPKKQPSLAELLGSNEDDDKPDYVKALEEKVAGYDKQISEWQEQKAQMEQHQQLQQRQQWEQNEQAQIGKFIDDSAEDYEYVAALKPIGSDADIYNGMISMYNNGYQPTHKDMADLVETRIEGVLEHLAGTKKFSSWLESKFGVKPQAKTTGSATTLTGQDASETPGTIDPDKLTEEESLKLAMKAAQDAAEKARNS